MHDPEVPPELLARAMPLIKELLRLLHEHQQRTEQPHATPPPMPTGQHRQLLRWVADKRDLTYKEIAGHMDISVRTLHTYKERIEVLYNVRGRAGLHRLALQLGLGK